MRIIARAPASVADVSGLIDTTEMYLRTVYELQEEGVVPLRARIAERLGHSGPTVSQTVARLERDGLLHVEGDRHLEFTDDGRAMAVRVMRKHRLAECLLVQVLGLPWESVHAEACRWEHVMSEDVERSILTLLGSPTESPFGNPIPGLDELVGGGSVLAGTDGLVPLAQAATDQERPVTVRRIAEPVQENEGVMAALDRAGVRPGAAISVRRSSSGVVVGHDGQSAELDAAAAAAVFVSQP